MSPFLTLLWLASTIARLADGRCGAGMQDCCAFCDGFAGGCSSHPCHGIGTELEVWNWEMWLETMQCGLFAHDATSPIPRPPASAKHLGMIRKHPPRKSLQCAHQSWGPVPFTIIHARLLSPDWKKEPLCLPMICSKCQSHRYG